MSDVVFPPLSIQINAPRGIAVKRKVLHTLISYNPPQLFHWSVSGPRGFDFSQHSQSVDGKQFELFD